MSGAVLEFAGMSKAYGGLRPLRVSALSIGPVDRIALLGFDQPSAEMFVNLATGATLPDSGEISLFGQPTAAIDNSAEWLATVDRFGIVSERAVLLDALTAVQNLAMPFTLDIEPPPADVRMRAEALAREVGLAESTWMVPVAQLDAVDWLRVRFGRAIALDPAILLVEHASAALPREQVPAVELSMRRVAAQRGIALVALTADEAFAKAAAERVLTLEPATGRLKAARRWF